MLSGLWALVMPAMAALMYVILRRILIPGLYDLYVYIVLGAGYSLAWLLFATITLTGTPYWAACGIIASAVLVVLQRRLLWFHWDMWTLFRGGRRTPLLGVDEIAQVVSGYAHFFTGGIRLLRTVGEESVTLRGSRGRIGQLKAYNVSIEGLLASLCTYWVPDPNTKTPAYVHEIVFTRDTSAPGGIRAALTA